MVAAREDDRGGLGVVGPGGGRHPPLPRRAHERAVLKGRRQPPRENLGVPAVPQERVWHAAVSQGGFRLKMLLLLWAPC